MNVLVLQNVQLALDYTVTRGGRLTALDQDWEHTHWPITCECKLFLKLLSHEY